MTNETSRLMELASAIANMSETEEERFEIAQFLEERIEKLPKYFSCVITMNTQIGVIRVMCDDPEEIGRRIEQLDRARRMAHISAVMAINQINRLCTSYGVQKVFQFPEIGDRELFAEAKIKGNPQSERIAMEDRELAADRIYDFCKEIFLDDASKERCKREQKPRDQEMLVIGKSGGYFRDRMQMEKIFGGKV